MKKKLIYFIAVLMILIQSPSFSLAKNSAGGPLEIAIKKYKMGNYTGCLNDCQYIVQRDPSNAIAYYYMAMSYAQAGRKDEAINSYAMVLNLGSNPKLKEYAATGKRCLETPDKCKTETTTETPTELDKFIAAPFNDGLSDSMRKDYQQKRLDTIKNEINSGRDLNDYQLKDSSNQRSQADVSNDVSKKPTNDEIVSALKVLNKAGINPYTQAATANNIGGQMNDYQNPEMTQLNMMMGEESQSRDNSAMLNMLPFMLAQNKNGTSNYSPQLLQAIIMNSMMNNFNFDLDKDKDK